MQFHLVHPYYINESFILVTHFESVYSLINLNKVSNHAAKSGNLSLWVSSGEAFSNKEIHKTSTKFVKSIDKKTVYSQGEFYKIIIFT